MVALSGAICGLGYRFVIRRKFSSTMFWKDCVKSDATVSLYIGEVYVLSSYKIFHIVHKYFKSIINKTIVVISKRTLFPTTRVSNYSIAMSLSSCIGNMRRRETPQNPDDVWKRTSASDMVKFCVTFSNPTNH